MSDVLVTVAPGCHMTVLATTGHGTLTLSAGNTARVSPERAEKLYAAGIIRHPVTGAPPPRPRAMKDGPSLSMNGGPFRPMGLLNEQPSWATTAEPPTSTPRPITAPPWSSAGPSVRQHDDSLVQITGADGRPWPSF